MYVIRILGYTDLNLAPALRYEVNLSVPGTWGIIVFCTSPWSLAQLQAVFNL
jgi:hypothetical protein